jgi:hypothetical protein
LTDNDTIILGPGEHIQITTDTKIIHVISSGTATDWSTVVVHFFEGLLAVIMMVAIIGWLWFTSDPAFYQSLKQVLLQACLH